MQYEIPIVWKSLKGYIVEADSLEEAIKKGKEQFMSECDESYIYGSHHVDGIVLKTYAPEIFNNNKIIV